jgi:tellurite resistance protein TehA-like permease
MGYLVAVVTGTPMGFNWILEVLMFYGFIIYPVVVIGQLIRIKIKPIPHMFKPTGAIFLAPTSLFFITWLNVAENMWGWNFPAVTWLAYIIVLVTIIRVATLIPDYIRGGFSPGMAALTFPSAIALVATFRMVGWLGANGMEEIAFWLNQFFAIQAYLTTSIMVYVGYNFFFHWRKDPVKPAPADSSAAKLG